MRGGLFDLIAALDLLKDISFELQIVGPKMIYKHEILDKHKSSNDIIKFIGPANEEIVKKLMLESDFLIIPAHQEAFGVANAEALATGLSVITSNVGGIPEVMDSWKKRMDGNILAIRLSWQIQFDMQLRILKRG